MKAVLLSFLSLAAVWAGDPAGHYYLQGVREVGSELLLKPDGTFEYMLAYGAADYQAEGTWKREDNSVVLNTKGKKEPPFRLLRSAASKEQGIRVWVKAPNGNAVPNIDVLLKTGAHFEKARTSSDGSAEFAPAKPTAVAFEIRVYGVQAGPFEVNPAHQEFFFEINGDAITRVPFENERLVMDGKSLVLRYWDKDKPMQYVRQ
jgi:hypothetical protein